jgi:hypothetical protein
MQVLGKYFSELIPIHFKANPACRKKSTPPAPGDENRRCQNHFGMDDRGK